MIIKQLTSDYYSILSIYLDDETKLMNCMQALETCIKGCISRNMTMESVRETLAAQNVKTHAVSTTLKRKARVRVEQWLSSVEMVLGRVQGDLSAVRRVINDDVSRSEEAAHPDMAGFISFLRSSAICTRPPASTPEPPARPCATVKPPPSRPPVPAWPCGGGNSSAAAARPPAPAIVIPSSLMCAKPPAKPGVFSFKQQM